MFLIHGLFSNFFSILFSIFVREFFFPLTFFFLCIFSCLIAIRVKYFFTPFLWMGGVYITLTRHALIVISEQTVNIDSSEIMFDLLLSILIIIQEFLALHFHFSNNSGENVTGFQLIFSNA